MATSNNSASLTVSTSAATRALSTRSARRLSAFITFRTHGGMEFAKALAVVVFGASEVVVATAAVVSTSTIDAAILVATAPSIVIVLGRALRPATTTRACLKARARLSMARASRRANRVSRKARRRTQSVAKCPILLARTAHRTLRRTLRRGVRVFAMAVVAVATRVVVAAAVQNTTVRPVLKEEVHTCALPRPVLVEKAAEYVPLATQRPVVRATRPAHKSLATAAIEVEPVVVTAPAVKILSLAEKEAARVAKADAKEAYSAWQADCIAAKAAYKKANPYTSSKDKGANPKGKKNNGGGGSRKRALYTPPQRPEILSQRADLGIVAGPTDSNSYGWTPMSDMELASFFYGEEIDGVPIADMGLSEVPTPMTSSPCFSGIYNMVVMTLVRNQSTDPTSVGILTAPKKVNCLDIDGVPYSPAKALTNKLYPNAKGFYGMETSRIVFKYMTEARNPVFSNTAGIVYLLQNLTGKTYSVFIKNSHIRNFTDTEGVERDFLNYMQLVLDESVREHHEAFDKYVAHCIENCEMSHEDAIETATGKYGTPKKYVVIQSTYVKNESGDYELIWNVEDVEQLEYEYNTRGYNVIAIQSSLLIRTITLDNIRLNGNVPCMPASVAEIAALQAKGVTKWTVDNMHEAVSPATNLHTWLTQILPSVTSVSFSFNGITTFSNSESVYEGEVKSVDSYSFTTDPSYYEEKGIEVGSIPAWTLNLWTNPIVAPAMVPHAKGQALIGATKVANTEVGQRTNPSTGYSPAGVLRKNIERQQAAKQAAKNKAAGIPKPPAESAVLTRKRQAEAEADRLQREAVVATLEINVINGAESVDSVDGALYVDSMPGGMAVTNNQPTITTFEGTRVNNVQADVIEEEELYAEPPVLTATTEERTSVPTEETFSAIVDIEDSDELCMAITLLDIPGIGLEYNTALATLCGDVGLFFEKLATDSKDYGMYSNGAIRVNESLSPNHWAQVTTHEMMHGVFDIVKEAGGEATVVAICENWLKNVGPSGAAPSGVNLEEQFLYSFMTYGHDIETLSAFVRGLVALDEAVWVLAHDALEIAVTSSKASSTVVGSTEPIILATKAVDVQAVRISNPVLDALLSEGNSDILVLADTKCVVPFEYNQAYPELVELAAERANNPERLGAAVSCAVGNGMTVHMVCAVSHEKGGSVMHQDALLEGLQQLAASFPGKSYLCEAGLGFGDDTKNTRILGVVRQVMGRAKVKTISLPAMKRLVKEWKAVGPNSNYIQGDLSKWTAGMTKGTAIVLEYVDSSRTPFVGNFYGIGDVACYATLAIVNEDGTVDEAALADGLTELKGYLGTASLPLPLYAYSTQMEVLEGVSVTPVEYANGVFIGAKIGVLNESPVSGMTLQMWYCLLLDSLKGDSEGLFEVSGLSTQLYSAVFKAAGLDVTLAGYALSPLPLLWLKHGIVLLIPGKNSKGLIDTAVEYEELIDAALLQTLVDLGIKVYTAEYVWDQRAKKSLIKGVERNVHSIDTGYGVYPLPEGLQGEELVKVVEEGGAYKFVNENVIGMNINIPELHTLDNYMQKHVLDTIQYLVDTQGVEMAIQYMMSCLPDVVKRVTDTKDGKVQYHLSVYNKSNAAEYYMEFATGVNSTKLSSRYCVVNNGTRQRTVNSITNLSGFPTAIYDGVTVAIGLAIAAASGRNMTQDVLEGYLAGTTNIWSRDENYGLELTKIVTPNFTLEDSLGVIIKNSGKTISSTANQNIDSKGVALGREETARWPYYMPCNASLDLSMMKYLMLKGEAVMCDKYATDRIIIGDGVTAMLGQILTPEAAAKLKGYDNEAFGLELALNPLNGERILTVCWPTDKASKALNRPSQFHGASQADGWNGNNLSWCPLHTLLGVGKRSAVRGFKRTFIAAVTDWLSPGSGAAVQHPKASWWAYGVNGSMNTFMDWHEVPAEQENKDANGNHKPGLRQSSMLMGPDAKNGPSGKNKEGKEVVVTDWFCNVFAKQWIAKKIEAAMYVDASKKEYRIYGPGEEMVVLFDKIYNKDGTEKAGYFPNGNTPKMPSARKVLFSNDLGKQDCIITGYEILPTNRGQRLQIVLKYSTVMDTRDSDTSRFSGAKCRGLGIKFIISHDGSIDYMGATALYNGVETSLQEIFNNGGIHATSEAFKGNYAMMQGFAAAHGGAYMDGVYLCIDQYLMNADGTMTLNPQYDENDDRMVSDLTDTDSYFYQWVKSITRTIRMRKTLNLDEWEYITACNTKSGKGATPQWAGVEVVEYSTDALQWDARNGEEIEDVKTVTVEYDVQVLVFDYWVQVEVAPPGACTGSQGMTAEQGANLEFMLKDTLTRLWGKGVDARKGVENLVASAEIHQRIEVGEYVEGVFTFDPMGVSHQQLIEHLLYQVSDTGARTLRPTKEFYILLEALFGGAAADTTELWTKLLADIDNGIAANIDYVDGKVVVCNDGYSFDDCCGFTDFIAAAIEGGYSGKGLAIHTASEETGENTVTYMDPSAFLQLGAFTSTLVAADPKNHKPSRRVTGAATGIVNDIRDAFLEWTSNQYWDRKGASSGVHRTNSRLRKSMMGWIGVNSKQSTMTNAKGVLGRIARIDNSGVAGKVCTGTGVQYAHHQYVHKDGRVHKIPVVIMHPDCLLAEGLNHGDIVGVGRTPTVSLVFCIVKFSRIYGRMGYLHMSFSVWAAGNNGDTDGDPCNRTRVGGVVQSGKWKGATYMQAVQMNKHPLSMGGYSIVCGIHPSQHDCADFVSFKDVWTKKAILNSPEFVPAAIVAWLATSKLKIKGMEPLVNLMLPATLFDSAVKVSGHYRSNVGIAYGWCSAYSAHMKEKHSFLETVVTVLLRTELALSYGTSAPTVDQMMEVLVSGEIYDAQREPAEGLGYTLADSIAGIHMKYPVIMALCDAKLDATTHKVGKAMNLAEMGQHIRVMLQASAWLWRGVYEGLGLSGYSPDASAFFEAFGIALRKGGKVCDESRTVDGKVIIQATADITADITNDITPPNTTTTIGEFIAKYYLRGNVEIANEIVAACLLYNGYRTIERGQHVQGEDPKMKTQLEVYTEIYNSVMAPWSDTNADCKAGEVTEYVKHFVLAGVFRRAGQGTTGVSIDDEMSSASSAKMIYTYAQDLWAAKLAAEKPAVLRNMMLNDIVVKSVNLYVKLVQIAGIEVVAQ